MYQIDWAATFSMFTGVGTLIMAVSVSFASGVAAKTLFESRDERRHGLSEKLLNTWQKDEYQKKYRRINEFYILKSENLKEYYKTNAKTPIDFTLFDEEFMKVLNDMISIKNFINKLNYYLDRKKLVFENINLDFNSRLILNSEDSMIKFYQVLKWGYKNINYSNLITTEDMKILDKFYSRVSSNKGYLKLSTYIKNGDETI